MEALLGQAARYKESRHPVRKDTIFYAFSVYKVVAVVAAGTQTNNETDNTEEFAFFF